MTRIYFTSLLQGTKVDSGEEFPNYLSKQWSFHLPIFYDGAPQSFGSVKQDVHANSTYKVVGVATTVSCGIEITIYFLLE